MFDDSQLVLLQAKLRLIQDVRQQVCAVMAELDRCQSLRLIIADPEFPWTGVPWRWWAKPLPPETFGRIVPLLVELQNIMDGSRVTGVETRKGHEENDA